MYGKNFKGFLRTDHGLLCTSDLRCSFFELVSYSFHIKSIKYMNSGRISWLSISIQIFEFPAILPWLPMMQLWAWTPLFHAKDRIPLRFGVCLSFYCFFFGFIAISQRGRRSFPLELELKNLQRIWIWAKKTAVLLRLVQDPARSKWPAFTSFYERGNSGYAIKPKKKKNSKTTNRHQNAVEYFAGKSFLFISFKKK